MFLTIYQVKKVSRKMMYAKDSSPEEKAWKERDTRIRNYLSRFETQISGVIDEMSHEIHFEKAKNYKVIKQVMNPEFIGIKVIRVYPRSAGGYWFMVELKRSDHPFDFACMELAEAKVVAPHLCAFYANIKRWPLTFRDWEWAASEKWCPIVEE